jgi:hypothetical protein
MQSVEQIQSEEELPDYIKLQDLKMLCFKTEPATKTHAKYNEICNALDLKRLNYYCHVQIKRIKGFTSDITFEK